MLRRAASSNSSSVATGEARVNAWQVVVPRGQQGVEEALRALARRSCGRRTSSPRDRPTLLQPRQQLLAEGAEHAGLRQVDVPIDEAGHDDAILDVGDREAGVTRAPPARDGAEIGDAAVVLTTRMAVSRGSGAASLSRCRRVSTGSSTKSKNVPRMPMVLMMWLSPFSGLCGGRRRALRPR